MSSNKKPRFYSSLSFGSRFCHLYMWSCCDLPTGTQIPFKAFVMRRKALPSHKLMSVNCSILTENELLHKVVEYIVV